MGAGKTTFTQGFAKGLGIKERVLSPTFLLVRQHQFGEDRRLFHIDLYRLEEIKNLEELGLVEILADPNNLVLIEWPEKLGPLLPKEAITVDIEIISEQERRITI